ncbi:MAG: type II secretion system protein [Halothermotrichaceae bacterium]
MEKNILSEKGITLIEVILAVLILGIISLALYNVLSNSFRMAKMGDDFSDLHLTVNNAATTITEELRYVKDSNITLHNTSNPVKSSGNEYLWLNSSNELVYTNDSGENRILTPDINIIDFDIDLGHYSNSDQDNFLNIHIEAEKDKNSYETDFRVLLYNINGLSSDSNNGSIEFQS